MTIIFSHSVECDLFFFKHPKTSTLLLPPLSLLKKTFFFLILQLSIWLHISWGQEPSLTLYRDYDSWNKTGAKLFSEQQEKLEISKSIRIWFYKVIFYFKFLFPLNLNLGWFGLVHVGSLKINPEPRWVLMYLNLDTIKFAFNSLNQKGILLKFHDL